MPVESIRSPVLLTNWLLHRSPMATTPPRFVSLLEASQNSGKWLVFHWFIIEAANKKAGDEIHRDRSGSVQSAGASVPVEMGSANLPACGCVSVHPVLMFTGVYRGSVTEVWLVKSQAIGNQIQSNSVSSSVLLPGCPGMGLNVLLL
jgi:hypothetical protein